MRSHAFVMTLLALGMELVACVPLEHDAAVSDSAHAGPGATGVLCGYDGATKRAPAPTHLVSEARWTCEGGRRILTGNGVPDHAIGAFPNPHNPNTLTPQTLSASFPLNPALSTGITARSGPRVQMGFALNGVKFDPSTAGTCDDMGRFCAMGPPSVGRWNIEALGQSHFGFGTDSSNAHVQPGGTYHYHGIPEEFVAKLNKGKAMTLIGWALDGFPIYARYGFSRPTDATSALAVMHGSYAVKTVPDPARPPVSVFPMGTFTQDYVYRAGAGDLDECNGRFGVTPEFPNGIYHYYATDDYPFVQRCVKGYL